MKKIIVLFLFWTGIVQSQTDTAISYSGIITTDTSLTSPQIYDLANSWFQKSFKSSKAVLNITDKEAGHLAGTGNFPFDLIIPMGTPGTGVINFSVNIYCKQGRCKYVIDDFRHECFNTDYPSWDIITSAAESPKVDWGVGKGMKNKQWIAMQQAVNAMAKQLISSLQESLTKKNDNW